MQQNFITVRGAKQHNLKNISVKIPKNKLVVFTGLSGSGKSSLAFDTIYAEGQRRYVESLSSYARQFLGLMNKPEVEAIEGLSPAISIDQKTTSHNPRSTVGTVTEIYDYLRLLFSRIGHPHCPKCGQEIKPQSTEQIVQQMLNQITTAASKNPQVRFAVLAPIVRDKKGEFKNLFTNLVKKGIRLARIDNSTVDLTEPITLIKTNKHTIAAFIERFTFSKKQPLPPLKSRLAQAVEASLKLADGLTILSQINDRSLSFPKKPKHFSDQLYSEKFACPNDNISLPDIEPRIFSFNSPHGACTTCSGLGSQLKVDPNLIIAPELSIAEGAVIPFAWAGHILKKSPFPLKVPFKNLPQATQEQIIEYFIPRLQRRYQQTASDHVRTGIKRFMRQEICPACQGKRLKPEALNVIIQGKNIWQICSLSIDKTHAWIKSLTKLISAREKIIASMILKELNNRLNFLNSVGLSYLTLNRQANTLAGGESQRIRLASQVGTGLTGVLYVLDEPTIGLHQKDNQRLIATLKKLKNIGNSIIVVEHDQETMEQADWLLDFGPQAGKFGGQITAYGTPKQIKNNSHSLTGKYLSGKNRVNVKTVIPSKPLPDLGSINLTGASHHNLKNINVSFPLGKLVCVTGVSGSGKSTLIHDTLFHALAHSLNRFHKQKPGPFSSLSGTDPITKVSLITQDPIGKTPRSNPVTYTKTFDHIRNFYAQTQAAKIRGFKAGRFSFNVKGGRCETCRGGGETKIAMQFLPDVYVKCDVCHGRRFNSETLAVNYRGKNISDVLNMTVDEALNFFAFLPPVKRKLTTLNQVGLGYIELGQPAPQLSGGEAQRIKLAKELSIKSLGHTLYLLDEPTTGLHFADLEKLLQVLKALVAQNSTVIIIEHNLDVIRNSDWIIDLGPEGGDKGGHLVTAGTPQQVAKIKNSYTGQFLKKTLY